MPGTLISELVEDDNRSAVRIKRALEVVYSSSSPPITARLEDLSETGMFIDTSHPLEVGAEMEFALTLPGDEAGEPIQGKGEVVWADQAVGVGVHFTKLNEEDRERIKWFVAEVFFG